MNSTLLFLPILFASLAAHALQPDKAIKIFDPKTLKEIVWTSKDGGVESVLKIRKTLDKPNQIEFWKKESGPTALIPDQWNIHRRIVILSHLENPEDIKSQEVLGRVTFVTDQEKYEGAYGSQGFVWTSGDATGKGFKFETQPDLKDLFAEGILGLGVHGLKSCDSNKVTRVDFIHGNWSLLKNKNKWFVKKGEDTQPARTGGIAPFLVQLCQFKVDRFFINVPQEKSSIAVKIFEGKNQNDIDTAKLSSKALDYLLQTNPDELKDSSLEEGRIALDHSKSQQERLKAIRKMKDDHSPAAVLPLKVLVDEKTEIDLYRYEAVDALAAIATKEAFKVIAERLEQVGRSGFELRLARALSMAMGRTFMADEKTADTERRAEVQDLLAAYRKKPPGR